MTFYIYSHFRFASFPVRIPMNSPQGQTGSKQARRSQDEHFCSALSMHQVMVRAALLFVWDQGHTRRRNSKKPHNLECLSYNSEVRIKRLKCFVFNWNRSKESSASLTLSWDKNCQSSILLDSCEWTPLAFCSHSPLYKSTQTVPVKGHLAVGQTQGWSHKALCQALHWTSATFCLRSYQTNLVALIALQAFSPPCLCKLKQEPYFKKKNNLRASVQAVFFAFITSPAGPAAWNRRVLCAILKPLCHA